MVTTLSSESANWILPSNSTAFTSTLPNYEEAIPIRVNREGVTNYVKSRGSLNLGDRATYGKKMSTSLGQGPIDFEAPPPKVLGREALQNYTRSRTSTPNLIYGNLDPPNPHHRQRVKREGQANYDKNRQIQMKSIFQNYGKSPLPAQPAPNTQGEVATNLFYTHQQGHIGSLMNNYGRLPVSAKPLPNVKGTAAEMNLQQSYGHSQILEHGVERYVSTPEPNVKGVQAHLNYDMAQGRTVNKLFHEYGKLPQSVRAAPKVKYDGIQNEVNGRGDAMRKTISQCPPSNRYLRPSQSVPLWP